MQDLPPNSTLPSHLQRKVDTICEAFEKRWLHGDSPTVEEYCQLAEGEFRDWLFYELTLASHQLSLGAKAATTSISESTQPEGEGRFASRSHETQLGAFKTAKLQHPMPARIGRFDIQYELGRGSAGVVYAAVDSLEGSPVAIKVPHPYLISTQEGMGRFLSEAKHAQLLQHPNVVRLVFFGEDGPGPYLAYEFLNGVDLKSCIKLGIELPLEMKLRIIAEAAIGLQASHDLRIIHRDVSPGNIMITVPEGQDLYDALEAQTITIKIIDFGIARPADTGTLQTKTGVMLGTPAYMSPEQASGMSKNVDARSDIYGLGVVMYQLLTGALPFSGEVQSVLSQRRSQEVPLLSATYPNLPAPIATICQRCLRLSPESRYASMNLLATDINNFLNGKPIVAKQVGFLENTVSIWKHSLAVRAASGFAILLLASIALTAYTANFFLAKQASSGLENQKVAPTATRQFIDALPRSAADRDLLARSISTATPQEMVLLAKAMNGVARESSLRWDVILEEIADVKASDQDQPVRQEKIDCLRCALDSGFFATLSLPQDMVRWIAGSINPENFETWQSLVQPYETEFMVSVAATYDAETLPSVRNGQALFLSDFHKKEIDKLLDYVARAQPNELSIWSKAIAQCTEKPSEAVLVDWKLFDELDGAERLSENDCVEQANRVLIQWLLGDADCFREALRQRPDPRLRTYVVHRSVAVGIQVDEMLQQLFVEKESDICYGLLLILGLADGSSLESSLRKKCKAWLIDNYQHHPD